MYQNVFNAKMYLDSSLTGNVVNLMKQYIKPFLKCLKFNFKWPPICVV